MRIRWLFIIPDAIASEGGLVEWPRCDGLIGSQVLSTKGVLSPSALRIRSSLATGSDCADRFFFLFFFHYRGDTFNRSA